MVDDAADSVGEENRVRQRRLSDSPKYVGQRAGCGNSGSVVVMAQPHGRDQAGSPEVTLGGQGPAFHLSTSAEAAGAREQCLFGNTVVLDLTRVVIIHLNLRRERLIPPLVAIEPG